MTMSVNSDVRGEIVISEVWYAHPSSFLGFGQKIKFDSGIFVCPAEFQLDRVDCFKKISGVFLPVNS